MENREDWGPRSFNIVLTGEGLPFNYKVEQGAKILEGLMQWRRSENGLVEFVGFSED